MVEVTCPACGPVGVAATDAEVLRNRRDGFCIYVFTCPRCGERSDGGDAGCAAELLAQGASRLELLPPQPRPLSLDDLLDLHDWLEQEPDWTDPGS